MRDPRVTEYRGQWVLYWREDGQPKRRLLKDENGDPITNQADAERAALDIQRLAVKPRGELIKDLADKYFKDKKGRIASYENMHFAWKAIEGDVGHLRPEHITREWSRAHAIAQRAKGRADGTIRKQLTVLSAICRWSEPNTAAVIELPPMPPPRNRHLTRDEAAKLIAGAVAPHIRLFIILALQTGARTQAILDLTWDLIDFDRGLIDLGKSPTRFKQRAVVPMEDDSRFALKAAYDGRQTEFVIEHGAQPVASIKKGFAKAAERAGLPGVTPHTLRHTAAVWMAEDGIPMSEIAQYLGHTSVAVTERVYARYSPTFLRKAAKSLRLQVPQNLGVHPMTKRK